MKASDVMVLPVITVKPYSSVKEAARTLLTHHISGVPVVDDQGKLIGIISEYVKAHARKVADVMTRQVVTATPDTPLYEVANLLERHSIKRVPILRDGQLVGIVSRANLIQAVAGAREKLQVSPTDAAIRARLLDHLNKQRWAHTARLNVTVDDGVVSLWGITNSDAERTAIRVAAEAIPGVRTVADNLVTLPLMGC
jgi:CBS-domain-containing membrane protein